MSERAHPVDPDFSSSQNNNPCDCPGLDAQLEYVRNDCIKNRPVRRTPQTYLPRPLSDWKRAPLYGQQTALYGVQADKKNSSSAPSQIADAVPDIDL